MYEKHSMLSQITELDYYLALSLGKGINLMEVRDNNCSQEFKYFSFDVKIFGTFLYTTDYCILSFSIISNEYPLYCFEWEF